MEELRLESDFSTAFCAVVSAGGAVSETLLSAAAQSQSQAHEYISTPAKKARRDSGSPMVALSTTPPVATPPAEGAATIGAGSHYPVERKVQPSQRGSTIAPDASRTKASVTTVCVASSAGSQPALANAYGVDATQLLQGLFSGGLVAGSSAGSSVLQFGGGGGAPMQAGLPQGAALQDLKQGLAS